MIGVARWVEEGGRSLFERCCWKVQYQGFCMLVFPSNFGPHKRNLMERVQRLYLLMLVKDASKRSVVQCK